MSEQHSTGTPWNFSRRKALGLGLGISAAAALAACGGGSSGGEDEVEELKAEPDGDLNFFNYAEYIDPDVIKGFEQEYGVKVVESYYSNASEALQKIAAGQPYDIVPLMSALFPSAIAAGIVRKVDPALIPHWDEIPDFFRNPPYDPNAQHSVPYGFGPAGVAWRTDKLGDQLTGSFMDLWDHDKANGHIYLFDNATEVLSMSLIAHGMPVNSDDPEQVKQAADYLLDLKPRMGGFQGDVAPLITSGQAWMSQAYSADALDAMREGAKVNFQLCDEGGLFTGGAWTIPTAAQHPGTALLFMDWVLRPENVKANVDYIGYPIPTEVGMKAFSETVSDYPMIDFPLEYMENEDGWILAPTGEREALWSSEWNRVKAG